MGRGKNCGKYLVKSEGGWEVMSREKWIEAGGRDEGVGRRYFEGGSVREVVEGYASRRGASRREKEKGEKSEMENDEDKARNNKELSCFCDFLEGLLRINPLERFTV
jgi:hypothetical protein